MHYTLANDTPKLPEDKQKHYKKAIGDARVWHDDILYEIATNTPQYRRQSITLPTDFPAEPDPLVVGIGLEITGPAAYPRFAPEDGLHVLRHARGTAKCLVAATDVKLSNYAPPSGITRRGAIGPQPQRRYYDRLAGVAEDLHRGVLPWRDGKLALLLADAIDRTLAKNMEEILEE